MRELIGARFPEHGIIGEEFGRVREDAEFVWVLDPIDGTKSFISGVPLFGTLIALTRAAQPILGIIDQPISRERWVGAAGRPTTLNGAAIRCRACAGLAAATLFATTPDMFRGPDAAGFARVCAGGQAGALRRRLLCLWPARRRLCRSRHRGRASSPTISAR